jgi:hypothetical protein
VPAATLLAVRLVAVLVATAALVGAADAATAPTELRIAVWAKGRDSGLPPKRWTLRCNPAGGTLPSPVQACARLLANLTAVKPVPPETVCTQIYGGPQEALVSGTLRGRRVWVRFNRRNGCEIARWNRLRSLFPVHA